MLTYHELTEQHNAVNRSYPSSLGPLFEKESKCETFHMKMSSVCKLIFMQSKCPVKVIFITMVSLLGSISAALSCLVHPLREFGAGARAPFPNSGW